MVQKPLSLVPSNTPSLVEKERRTSSKIVSSMTFEVLAKMHGITLQAVQKQLVDIVNKLRHHDDSIQLWKYLNR
jgi:hypothetical protein